jgi:hypothetical protein
MGDFWGNGVAASRNSISPKIAPFPTTCLSILIARLGNYFYDLKTIVVGAFTNHGEPPQTPTP